jgi:hypothetical protein
MGETTGITHKSSKISDYIILLEIFRITNETTKPPSARVTLGTGVWVF